MKAELIHRLKHVTAEGDIIEMVVWKVPQPVSPCTHGFKYSLVYVVEGRRVIGFDNERGKGDHVHVEGEERPYAFESVERLIEDFVEAVERWREKR